MHNSTSAFCPGPRPRLSEILDYELRGSGGAPSRWIPSDIKSVWEPLDGKTWEEIYVGELGELRLPLHVASRYLRDASDGLVYPMTILYALEKMNEDDMWTKKDTLTIHVCTASEYSIRRSLITHVYCFRWWARLRKKIHDLFFLKRYCIECQI